MSIVIPARRIVGLIPGLFATVILFLAGCAKEPAPPLCAMEHGLVL